MRRRWTSLGVPGFALLAAAACAWAQGASPAGAFVNFESGHVRPLALSPDRTRLFAVNTPDNRLAIYDVSAGGLTLVAEVPVGLEPVFGANLVAYNAAGSGEKAAVVLPALGWTAYDSATTPKGYRFKGPGPITQVIVRLDQVKVKGGGALWAYTLDEPSQGRMALRLQLGSQPAWCADAAPRTSGNPPSSASYDRVDRFTGQSTAPPPVVCPAVP